MTDLAQWEQAHPAAARALWSLLTPTSPAPPGAGSEARVQSAVRLEAAKGGVRVYRNNVGVLKDDRGVPLRFGLANDSKAMNSVVKSSDLIGWRPILITQGMVGTKIAKFVSIECKAAGWKWTATEREKAQAAWIALVNRDGGEGYFSTGQVIA